MVSCPHVSTLPLTSRGTEVESKQGAERVEDGSSVLRSGTVKRLMMEKVGHLPTKVNAKKYGNHTGKVGKMKVEVKPQKPRKQIMQNSFEQAKSRRHLTANVENKWFSDLHENVTPTISNNSKTQNSWFINLHKNVNSAKSPNVHVPSGILPKPRKRHLSLQRPISLDPFCARMALHIFRNPSEPSHIFTHTDMPPYAPINPAKPSANFSRPRPTIDRATETLP